MKPRRLDSLVKATHDRDPTVRKVAVRELCPCVVKVNDARAWDRVLELTRDSNRDVRRIALHTIIDGSPRSRQNEVVRALEAMRDDPDQRLRRQVRKVLARHRATGRVNLAGH
jgi:hypothetical protein